MKHKLSNDGGFRFAVRPVLWAGIALALGSLSLPALAATFTVNSTADTIDANPGDGTCADSNGKCTLRAAVMEANALGGADTIGFDPMTAGGKPIFIFLKRTAPADTPDSDATGDLDITGDLTIDGGTGVPVTVDAFFGSRAFDVQSGTVSLANLKIRNGASVDSGGGILVEAGASLSLEAVTVSGNKAESSTGDAVGGGIAVLGTLTAQDSVITGNTASSSGGAADGGGIAVDTGGTLTLVRTEIGGNSADFGGGIASRGADTLTNVVLDGNSASESAGDGDGSAVVHDGGTLSMTNVTIVSNAGDGAAVTLDNGATFILSNTLIATNTNANGSEADCDNGTGGAGGTITSRGFNLIGSNAGCTFTKTGNDQVGTAAAPINPKLSDVVPFLPLLKSPALDKGDTQTQSSGGSCANDDINGNTRPFDGNNDTIKACDIGAVERQANNIPAADDGSLATPMNFAVSGAVSGSDDDGDPLTFTLLTQPASGTLTLASDFATSGAFTYTPNPGFVGDDSFTFKVNDGLDDSAPGKQTITATDTDASPKTGASAFGPWALLGLALFLPWRLRRKAHAGPGKSTRRAI